LTQFGSTISVYNKPANLLTAQTFSDPPMNILPVTKTGSTFTFHDSTVDVPDTIRELPDGEFKLGVRPHHMLLEKPKGRSMKLKCRVSTTEITGSESFIHLESADAHMVALIHGIHRVAVDDTLEAYLNQKNLFVFDRNENLVAAPSLDGGE
jgi:glycerol transport system ATP-binding protein